MAKLKSIYSVNYGCTNRIGERVGTLNLITFLLKDSNVLTGLGRIPCFFNGRKVSSRKAIIDLLIKETKKRTVVKLQWCNDINEGFERCLAVQTFRNQKVFESTIYCRLSGVYTAEQINQYPVLTNNN